MKIRIVIMIMIITNNDDDNNYKNDKLLQSLVLKYLQLHQKTS